LKSLAIKERLGNEHGAALTFATLGQLALAQAQHLVAGQWFVRALAVFSKLQVLYFRDMALSHLVETLRTPPSFRPPHLAGALPETGAGWTHRFLGLDESQESRLKVGFGKPSNPPPTA
jgi:hypothetical protein